MHITCVTCCAFPKFHVPSEYKFGQNSAYASDATLVEKGTYIVIYLFAVLSYLKTWVLTWELPGIDALVNHESDSIC